jgi:anti-anti-sigma factor
LNSGEIRVANREGVYVIKMIGDVRLTLSLAFDKFIKRMFEAAEFRLVIFDLSDAIAIDSTTLGLMAKISLTGHREYGVNPLTITPNPNITRLLETMGFNELLQIVESSDIQCEHFEVLGAEDDADLESHYREKVLEAHRALIEMSNDNSETFKELIQSLEAGRN